MKFVGELKLPVPSPNKMETLFMSHVGNGEILLAIAVEITHRY